MGFRSKILIAILVFIAVHAPAYGTGFLAAPEVGLEEFGYDTSGTIDNAAKILVSLAGIGLIGFAALSVLAAWIVIKGDRAGLAVTVVLGGTYLLLGIYAFFEQLWVDALFIGCFGIAITLLPGMLWKSIGPTRSFSSGAGHLAPKILKTDGRLRVFVEEVTATLLAGKRHQTPGLGTFSTCTRKATTNRAAGKMAMFRASAELRAYANGGRPPPVSGPHSQVVSFIVLAMQCEQGIDVPLLRRMAVVPVPEKKPKLIFHGAKEHNELLATP